MTKICTNCKENLEAIKFSKDKRNLSGLQSECNECRKKYKQGERDRRAAGIGAIHITEKTCNKCIETKPTSEFYKDRGHADGHASICKACKNVGVAGWREKKREEYNEYMRKYRKTQPRKYNQERNRMLRHRYGIEAEQYEAMLAQQKNACAMCKKETPDRKLVVDHSHITNEVRGLLCDGCNVKIAIFDMPELLQAAKEYLKSE